MAYLEPASNSGLKPQSLSDKKRKNKTKLVGISCKLLTKNSIYKELKIRINTCDKMCCINGCMVISNLLMFLVPYDLQKIPEIFVGKQFAMY